MTERERLIKLLKKSRNNEYLSFYDLDDLWDDLDDCAEYMADYLIKNGVVVLPYNIGDEVLYIEKAVACGDNYIECGTVVQISLDNKSRTVSVRTSGMFYQLNDGDIYPTFEEAKKALERSKR